MRDWRCRRASATRDKVGETVMTPAPFAVSLISRCLLIAQWSTTSVGTAADCLALRLVPPTKQMRPSPSVMRCPARSARDLDRSPERAAVERHRDAGSCSGAASGGTVFAGAAPVLAVTARPDAQLQVRGTHMPGLMVTGARERYQAASGHLGKALRCPPAQNGPVTTRTTPQRRAVSLRCTHPDPVLRKPGRVSGGPQTLPVSAEGARRSTHRAGG